MEQRIVSWLLANIGLAFIPLIATVIVFILIDKGAGNFFVKLFTVLRNSNKDGEFCILANAISATTICAILVETLKSGKMPVGAILYLISLIIITILSALMWGVTSTAKKSSGSINVNEITLAVLSIGIAIASGTVSYYAAQAAAIL